MLYGTDIFKIVSKMVQGISWSGCSKTGRCSCYTAAQASRQGHSKIMIRTVDTYVVILAIANFHKINVSELWIAFGTGKQLRYIPGHTIAHIMTPLAREGLPFFHAVTGCTTVFAFSGRGTKGAYETWKSFPQVSASFGHLSARLDSISGADFEMIGKFVILLYSRTCLASSINEARQLLFSQGTRTLNNIPPTEDALLQHVKRAAHQAGFIWGQSLENIQQIPNFSNWGWQQIDDRWTPIWITLPEASKFSQELIHCGRKKPVGDFANASRQTCHALHCAIVLDNVTEIN